RWAMLTKVHHCMADGIAAAHMLAGLCDEGVSDSYTHHIRSTREPKQVVSMVSNANPLSLVTGLWNLSTAITSGAVRAAQGAGEIAIGLLRPTSSPLNGPIGDLRRYGGARVALADIELVCRTFDVTINDVALAAITESYRDALVKGG